MSEFTIPCDTVVRLANVLRGIPDTVDPVFRTLRLENGCVIATDRKFMAVEYVGEFTGTFHFILDEALIAQCKIEAGYNASLSIIYNEVLGYGVAKTALGYTANYNCAYAGPANDFDRWRSIVAQTAESSKESVGAMFWDTDGISKLSASSPSGSVVFEEKINTNRPTLMRDVHDNRWIGIFNPYSSDIAYQPATLPTWANVR